MGDLECSICINEYTQTGNHIPRILPCHDTLCESCLTRILNGASSLQCPHCGRIYAAQRGYLTFLQNRYIVEQLKKKPTRVRRDFYVKHNDVSVALYCNACAEAICTRCLSRYHSGHDVVGLQDLKEGGCQTLYQNIAGVKEVLKFKKERLVSKIRELDAKKVQTITHIRKEKEEFSRIFDGMIANVIEQHKKTRGQICEKIYSVENNLATLNSIEGSTSPNMASFAEIKERSSNVQQINRAVSNSLSDTQKYRYLAYSVDRDEIESAKRSCGKLQGWLTNVDFSLPGNPNTQPIKVVNPAMQRKSAPVNRIPNRLPKESRPNSQAQSESIQKLDFRN